MARGSARGWRDRAHRPRAEPRWLRRILPCWVRAGDPPPRLPSILGHPRGVRLQAQPGCWCSRRSWPGSDPGAAAHRVCPRARARGVGPRAAGAVSRPVAPGPKGGSRRLAIPRRLPRAQGQTFRYLSAGHHGRFRSPHSPLLADHDGHTVQVQLLPGTAGALLEGLDDPKSVVRPPLELEVRLELADHAVASALDRPFGYDRAVVVAYPQRDGAFEGGAVPGYVCRVPHHVGGGWMVDLDERTA